MSGTEHTRAPKTPSWGSHPDTWPLSPQTAPNDPGMAAPDTAGSPPQQQAVASDGTAAPKNTLTAETLAQRGHARPADGGFDLGTIAWILVVLAAGALGLWWLRQRREDSRRGYILPRRPEHDPSSPSLHEIARGAQPRAVAYPGSEPLRMKWKEPATDGHAPSLLGTPGGFEPTATSSARRGAVASTRDDAERTAPSPDSAALVRNVDEILRTIREHWQWHESVTNQLYARLGDLATRIGAGSGADRAVPAARASSPYLPPDSAPVAGHTLEEHLLGRWNEIDWERGTPSLSQIELLLRDEGYDLVEGILGTYALAVPRRSADDARSPVYILPLLGKANAHYDGWLFERPQTGDSAKLAAVAKVRFIERGGSRVASIERLKAGNEKLSEVFTVIEPGRIE